MGEPEEEQFWTFLSLWATNWSHFVENRDAFYDLLKAIQQGDSPVCNAETFSDFVRWLYDLILPYIPEKRHDKFRQQTRQFWRKALTGELPAEDWKDFQLRKALNE